MNRVSTRDLTFSALIAAVYAALTMALPALSYGPVQLRFSEALTVLPFFFPAATPGLFVGCLLSNLLSQYGPMDVVVGSLATLLAAVWTQHCPNRLLAPLPPVVCNAVLVGGMIAWLECGGFTSAFAGAFAFNALTVGLGELVACYVLGSLLLAVLPRIPFFRSMIPQRRLEGTAQAGRA